MESIAKIDRAEMANCKFRSLLLYVVLYYEPVHYWYVHGTTTAATAIEIEEGTAKFHELPKRMKSAR